MKTENKNFNWGIKKLQIQVHKMSNKTLIAEWKQIRNHNNSCWNINHFNCTFCDNIKNCRNCLSYEELITRELLKRGLFDLAINIAYNRREKQTIKQFVRPLEGISFTQFN
ncbi:MAG TPA: hypothetical protein VMX55_00790 [candidate division Zixibacteria bacterium]|nr:hypothetical protein [candidate division Zixibacteria bacterium]